jgi:hypothetical protein
MTTAAPSESPLSRQNLVVLGFPSLDPGFDRIEPVVEKLLCRPRFLTWQARCRGRDSFMPGFRLIQFSIAV